MNSREVRQEAGSYIRQLTTVALAGIVLFIDSQIIKSHY